MVQSPAQITDLGLNPDTSHTTLGKLQASSEGTVVRLRTGHWVAHACKPSIKETEAGPVQTTVRPCLKKKKSV